jgi:hypothetical protein
MKDKEDLTDVLRIDKEVRKEVSQIYGRPWLSFPRRPLRRLYPPYGEVDSSRV